MTLLGMVDWTSLDRAGKPIASVVPLFETSNSALRKIKADVEFPSEGRVFWFKAEGIKKDELIYFNVEENSDERYQFKVSDHQVAIEVRDFRKLGSPEDVRLALLSGLKFAGLVSGRSLLWCAGDLIVGPVQLVTLSSGLFTFEHPQKHKIACYLKKEIEIIEVPAKPFKRYALSENGSFVPNFYVDWGDDEDVAKRAIKWAVARASQDTSAINLTQKQIREASDYLAKLGGEAEFKLERYRLDRTLKMFADVRRADSEAAAAVEELQKVPEIAKELEQLRESIRSATEQDVRESLRVELERLETARQEQAVIEADTKAAKENLQNLRTEKLEAIDELDEEVSNRLSEILNRPSAFLANVAVLNPFLQQSSKPISAQKAPTPAQVISWPTDAHRITDFKEFRKALVKSSRAEGFSPDVLSRIHAAMSVRFLPLLMGPRAIRALQAYANVACNGRIFRIQGTPSLLEPSDIFGKVDFAVGRFVPHPAGLIDLIKFAEKKDELGLIVIEGANRAPIESYLLPLLSCALANSALRIFHPSTVTSDDPYRDSFDIRWPRNLLLSATLVEGATTLPITPDIWASAIAVETDQEIGRKTQLSEVFEIDPSLEFPEMPEKQIGVSDELFEALPEYSAYRDTCEQFSSALSRFENNKAKLETAAIESFLSPLLVTLNSDERREAALARMVKGVSGRTNSSDLELLVERLRRRLT